MKHIPNSSSRATSRQQAPAPRQQAPAPRQQGAATNQSDVHDASLAGFPSNQARTGSPQNNNRSNADQPQPNGHDQSPPQSVSISSSVKAGYIKDKHGSYIKDEHGNKVLRHYLDPASVPGRELRRKLQLTRHRPQWANQAADLQPKARSLVKFQEDREVMTFDEQALPSQLEFTQEGFDVIPIDITDEDWRAGLKQDATHLETSRPSENHHREQSSSVQPQRSTSPTSPRPREAAVTTTNISNAPPAGLDASFIGEDYSTADRDAQPPPDQPVSRVRQDPPEFRNGRRTER